MATITGNTYPVRDQLKALGGKWDAARKAWVVPEAKAAEAQKLVQNAPRQTFKRSCSCTSSCCRRGCSCGRECNCKGGPIYDCE